MRNEISPEIWGQYRDYFNHQYINLYKDQAKDMVRIEAKRRDGSHKREILVNKCWLAHFYRYYGTWRDNER